MSVIKKEILGTEIFFLPVTKEHGSFGIIHEGTRITHFEPTYKRYDIPKGEYIIVGKLSQIGDIKTQVLIDFEMNEFDIFKTPKEKLLHHLYYNGIKTIDMMELHKPSINYWGVTDKEIEIFNKDLKEWEEERKTAPEDYLIFLNLKELEKKNEKNLEK